MRLALVVAAAALLAAGCGGSGSPAKSAADVAPVDTYALVAGNPSDVREALTLLPAGARVLELVPRARAVSGAYGVPVAVLDPGASLAVGITRGKPPPGLPHARVRGWAVFSKSRAAVDAVRHAKRRLSESSWYRPVSGDVSLQSRALTVTAKRDGDAQVAEQDLLVSRDVEHRLAALIPDDSLGAAVFDQVPTISFAEQLERGLGVPYADLLALAPHGAVLFLRAGVPIPTVTLIAPGGTLASARRVVTELDPAAPPYVPATLDGVPLRLVHFGALDLYYGRFEGALVLTDDPGLKLHDVSGLAPDGLPAKTADWYYLAPGHGLPALQSLATLVGTRLSSSFRDRLAALHSVLVYRAEGKLVVRVS